MCCTSEHREQWIRIQCSTYNMLMESQLNLLHGTITAALSGRSSAGAIQAACNVHRWLQQKAPCYMIDCCILTSDVALQQHNLRSTDCHQLLVLRHRRSLFRHRPLGLLCGRPRGLELTSRLSVKSYTCLR